MEHPVEFFVALESQVWDALVRGDADRELLASDFVGVYPSGFEDRAGHAEQLVDGPTVASYAIAEARVVRVSGAAALVCYRAEFRRLRDGLPGDDETMYISSLWTDSDGRWSNLFSQDTPAGHGPLRVSHPAR